ncbi:MAG: HAD family acid phosphatase [Nocardioides sp.]
MGSPLAAHAKTDQANLAPRTHFTMQPDGSSGLTAHGAGIPNIDSVKSTIRAYYGATSAGIANKDASPYISEMKQTEAAILAQMPTAPAPNLAVVFDADDTTLWTYDMEDGAMHFNFDPTLQGTWVSQGLFPATPGMVDFVKAVQDKGYNIYGITGRGASQEADTLANLQKVGYTEFNADNFFTKYATPDTKPSYLDCNSGQPSTDIYGVTTPDDPAKCSTVEYKAGTRAYIEDKVNGLGQTIVLNIGDQFSDLQGGHAMNNVKLPNPTYYLPSPDVTGAPASDSSLTPKTEFDMAPDGSSGAKEAGADVPNIDSVKSTIRAYYHASSTGIAAKDASPYISDLARIEKGWAYKLGKQCAAGVRQGTKPAVVFDADDTTLWTYDMEDGAMHFNFDPTLQNQWVQDERFAAVPGMPSVVAAAKAAGCKVVGLTGRNSGQRTATLDNLAKYYYDENDAPLFRSQYYFTKWNASNGEQPPAYIDPTVDGKDGISTIDYKASTRKYVQDHFGFHIIANFGDQYSDLIGGSSDTAVKLPNPTYYLP